MPARSDRPAAPPVLPVASLEDPRLISILVAEHSSLLSARSLAYNEAFTRGGMFLTFLSTSFVALALVAQGVSFGDPLLPIAAIVLAFDLVVGVTTFMRIGGANTDDLRAVHGMARIRHAYTQVAPIATPYFTTATHDDMVSVTAAYGSESDSVVDSVVYGLTTSAGMIGLITSMVGGVFAAVLSLIAIPASGGAVWIGFAGGFAIFVILVMWTLRSVTRAQALFTARFPAPDREPVVSETLAV